MRRPDKILQFKRSARNGAHAVPYFVSTIIPISFRKGVGNTPPTLTITPSYFISNILTA